VHEVLFICGPLGHKEGETSSHRVGGGLWGVCADQMRVNSGVLVPCWLIKSLLPREKGLGLDVMRFNVALRGGRLE
jgi:hypothetical protein